MLTAIIKKVNKFIPRRRNKWKMPQWMVKYCTTDILMYTKEECEHYMNAVIKDETAWSIKAIISTLIKLHDKRLI